MLAKVPATAHDEIRDAYWVIFDTDALTAAGARPGHQLVTAAQARIDAFARTYGTLYPPRPSSACSRTERPAAGSRSSAGSPARPAASTWSGPSWTAPAEDGAA